MYIPIKYIHMPSTPPNRDHSLGPDIATGWKSHASVPRLRQFALLFINPRIDQLSKSLTSFGSQQSYRIVYMGPRHPSNLKAFKAYAATPDSTHVEESFIYSTEPIPKFEFVHACEKEKYFPIRPSQYRLFTGVNPTIKKDDLKFESNFECGNLDLAICVSPNEYDLLMRVDSNTRGHTSWFCFKVSNFNGEKVKFNILNFQKLGLLYQDGMRPYVWTSSGKEWTQDGISVELKNRRLRYEDPEGRKMNCLSFSYEFRKENKQVYFAYCVPYSFSYLLSFLRKAKQDYPHILKVSLESESSGGLPIPVLTITNFSTETSKLVCLCTGRLHPGETQGSWAMQGFIRMLLSPSGYYLREKTVFKIVPMVNVDGVVLGNFRTGIAGRDLNRVFNCPERYPEIELIRGLAQSEKPFLYLDFHGHSSKKNVFLYGPDYALQNRNYLPSRLLPKMISKQTDAFRYYSCVFRISESKKTTGRAVMLHCHNVPFSFTVEASAYGYGSKQQFKLFDKKGYLAVGQSIATALSHFTVIMLLSPKRGENKKQEKQEKQEKGKESPRLERAKGEFILENIDFARLSTQDKQLLQSIMPESEQRVRQEEAERYGEEENPEESDSDFQDESNDYTDKEMKRIVSLKSQHNLSCSPKKKPSRANKPTKPNEQVSRQLQVNKSIRLNRGLPVSPPLRQARRQSRQSREDKLMKVSSMPFQKYAYEQMIDRERELLERSNKVIYCDWSRHYESSDLAQKSLEKIEKIDKMRTINQINLNYSESLHHQKPQPLNFEYMRRDREMDLLKRRGDAGGLKTMAQGNMAQGNIVPMLSIKKSLLPLLGRNGNSSKVEESSLLTEILEQHERSKQAKKRKEFKILYL